MDSFRDSFNNSFQIDQGFTQGSRFTQGFLKTPPENLSKIPPRITSEISPDITSKILFRIPDCPVFSTDIPSGLPPKIRTEISLLIPPGIPSWELSRIYPGIPSEISLEIPSKISPGIFK